VRQIHNEVMLPQHDRKKKMRINSMRKKKNKFFEKKVHGKCDPFLWQKTRL